MEAPVFQLEKTSFLIAGTNANGENQRLFVDGIEILPDESQQIRNHSPDGFSWGYGGSGPAQTALALCLHLFKNRHVAEVLYQDFKAVFVSRWKPAGLPFEYTIDVADFLIEHRDRLKLALEREEWEREDAEWMELEEDEPETSATKNRTVPVPAHDWHIGDLVYINHSDYLCNALVYHIYNRGDGTEGISLITETGNDTGGWEPAMWKFIEFRHHTGLLYEFTNVARLRRDFERGYFTPYFEIL
ncbi:DUF6166 domain-containing protein [Larkinella sp. GY13]|uniref:DUF6166 domain-containing protein n=1 Tax=Larkinella sp. GY13 TaxID=3453720 RepID=UPI003EEC4F36